MGRFIYENQVRADFDDRVLAHLQAVITTKLRRGEAFTLTRKEDVSIGDGRTTVWLHPGCGLAFKYYGSRTPALNRSWLEALTHTANAPSGLYVVPEPPESARRERETVGAS